MSLFSYEKNYTDLEPLKSFYEKEITLKPSQLFEYFYGDGAPPMIGMIDELHSAKDLYAITR
ncbi:Uncharacterised protein [Sphingobacterium thalpophilum]|uniref:Uncharacterized protein n=1 Tax=Sphingobacterium thalpophilum TaxID=259 RepID=A0A4U9URD1_9SPHI|nr:Uncharacterised protein [Sphingobacterium thalpophilum]